MNTLIPVSKTNSISILLLNAWSAEFALRIMPLGEQGDMQPIAWTCPQAYYAFLFSVRAVLAVDGIMLANPDTLEKQVGRWVRSGRYGRGFTEATNPLTELLNFRPNTPAKPLMLLPEQIARFQEKLKAKVHAVSIIHETYILNRLGDDSYRAMIDALPDYLKNGFVGARATLLLQDD